VKEQAVNCDGGEEMLINRCCGPPLKAGGRHARPARPRQEAIDLDPSSRL
jgi:hypothetical protein